MSKVMIARTTLLAGLAALVVGMPACSAQNAPAEAIEAPTAPPGQSTSKPSRGIMLNIKRYEPGSKHFDRKGPKTEFISSARAVDVARGEQAVIKPVQGGIWFMVRAGEAKETAEQDVVVATFAEANQSGGGPIITIDNRLDRTLYIPPIIIDREAVSANAKGGKGCNLSAGASYSEQLSDKALSFVLANVEKTMDAPTCGNNHRFYPLPPA